MNSTTATSDIIGAFLKLPPMDDKEGYVTLLSCDCYDNDSPSDAARIHLVDLNRKRIPTNGAKIWNNDVLIQGPRDPYHGALLGKLVEQQQIYKIVQVGTSGIDFSAYDSVPTFPNFPNNIGITFSNISAAVPPIERIANIKWTSDEVTATAKKVLEVVSKLDPEQRVLIHGRYGSGGGAVVAVCREAHRRFKKNNNQLDEKVAVELIKELRQKRYSAIVTKEQFQVIVDFIKLLNEKK